MNRAQSIEQGFVIDDCCNPPVAYKGPRFNPTEWHCVPSEREERLVALLEAIRARVVGEFDHPALLKMGPLGQTETDIRNWIDEGLQ